MTLRALVGATVVDGTGRRPVADALVLVEDGRITAVDDATRTAAPQHADVIDVRGKYIIPGLMDANVHLYAGIVPDLLLEYEGRYADLVEEAAQVALGSGITTVFDTWGPLWPLTAVRDRINSGDTVGSRIFVAGNIIGLDGPLSSDFYSPGNVLSGETVGRINAHWEQGVGSELLWLTADGVRDRVREYIARSPIDFVKYAASGHKPRQFITFSEPAQRAIVDEAHRAGLTVQAHTTTVESLRMEIAAGADLLQHADSTGREPIPDETLATIVDRALPVAALVCTERHVAWLKEFAPEPERTYDTTRDLNDRRLIAAGARLLLTTDAFAWGPRVENHPLLAGRLRDVPDNPIQLGESHLYWLRGVIERGMRPMEALLSATRYVAEAYHVADELGTVEPGKRADLVVLDEDPLASVHAYGRIAHVMKDGILIDRDSLPRRRVLTENRSALVD